MMKNKGTLIITILFMAINMAYGQRPPKPDLKKIKALKIAFFTEHIGLTSAEAETFWPIYNEHERSRFRLGRIRRQELHSKLGNEDISEKEAGELLDKYLEFEEEERELGKVFILKIKNILSAKKALFLIRAERDFKNQLIKQYRKRHGGR